jgi:hypothetical protein
MTIEERFWAKVQKTDGCWLWTGSKMPKGYGSFGYGRRTRTAHRMAFEWAKGPVPPGLFVCHHCDTPACVNPDHLYAGTAQQNTDDMMRRGRRRDGGPKPNEAYNQKLNPVAIRVIRYLRSRGVSGPRLARAYRLDHTTVYAICKREVWKHVD